MRKAYVVRVRCILNGADTTKRLWLPEGLEGHEVLARMRKYVPSNERNHIRLLLIQLSADQHRDLFPNI